MANCKRCNDTKRATMGKWYTDCPECVPRESLESVDATPDEGYVLRILQAHLDANTRSTITDNTEGKPPTSPLCVAMNEAQEERAALLQEAISILQVQAREEEECDHAFINQSTGICAACGEKMKYDQDHDRFVAPSSA